jgi:hypothetical protein
MALSCARIPCKCGDPASHAGSPASKGRGADGDRARASSAINWAELPAVGLAGSFAWGLRGGI